MTNLNIDDYSRKSKDFENSLNDNYKKKNRIFYTDVQLSMNIISYLNIDTDSIIIDPCCGAGSFLYAAILNNCKHVYGADLIDKAVSVCKDLTGLSSIEKYDTLGHPGHEILNALDLKEKADYIIGNPPYVTMDKDTTISTGDCNFLQSVKNSGGNFFVAAIYRAFELAKDNGYISYVVPKNFLHVKAYSRLRNTILNSKRIISIIDLNSYFSDVRGEQIVLTLRNTFKTDNKISIMKLENGKFIEQCTIPQSFYINEMLLFKNEEEYSIYRKMQRSYKKLSDICSGHIGRGRSISPHAVKGKDIQKFGFKDREVPNAGNQIFIQNIYSTESGIIASFAGDYEASQTVTIFASSDENTCRYILGILHSRLCNFWLYKFCYNSSKLTMHTDKKYLETIPLVKDDKSNEFLQIIGIVTRLETLDYMSSDWFDALDNINRLVYKIYKINDKEAAYIDAEMRSIQSEKWSGNR